MAPTAAETNGAGPPESSIAEESSATGLQGLQRAPSTKSGASKSELNKDVGAKAPPPKSANASKDGKPSGKELKDAKDAKAKAKAARRAQQKQSQQGQPAVDPPGAKQAESANKSIRRASNAASTKPSVPKSHHKRTSSSGQKALPIRGSDTQGTPIDAEQKKNEKKVALFDHLYGPPRRTTFTGAGKDIHPAVLALGLQMSNYVVCGSNARCVAMLLAFKQTIQSYITPPHTSLPRHLTTHLSSQIDYLVSCRPLSISMGNAIRWIKVEISAVDVSTPETSAKSDLCDAIDNFIRERVIVADQVIATKASEKIRDGDVVVTYAKSSIVQKVLVQATQQGKSFKVIVVDSRPLYEGKNLARALSDLDPNIQVQYCLINGIDHVMRSATKVLLGAHSMMSNGRLYSRIGTALVAMAAHEIKIPVTVCCESIKFTDRVALDSFVHNEIAPPDELIPLYTEKGTGLDGWRDIPNLQLLNLMYDLTPAEYINMVVTEYGSLPPSSVPVVHRLSTNT